MATEQDREPLSGTQSQAPMPAGAVFLSYASEDAAAAERIATALRNAGIEVWFDKSELRGGDAWDRLIHQQIHDCRLFVAVISAHTEARDEGYFRREWKLAVDRTHDMAEDKAFIVPVAIDSTSERSARVPDPFKRVQWTRLPGGETSPVFVERVRRLLAPDASPAHAATTRAGSTTAPLSPTSLPQPRRYRVGLWMTGAVLAAVLASIAVDKLWVSRHLPPPTSPAAPPAQTATGAPVAQAAFNPPAHSIAVLPFVNMSGDKEQEYFSDGLTEEILNSLARINELQVAARTSAFSFKGKDTDIGTIAHKLNVASILEGSVRRSGHVIRVTAQLNNAVTGFHLWSQTYDRDLRDALVVQADIAKAVAGALKVTLLADSTGRLELGGTRNPDAFDAYLRASKSAQRAVKEQDVLNVIAGFTKAVQLDANYALAFAGRSIALLGAAGEERPGNAAYRDFVTRADADARQSISLAPDLADGHLALASVFEQVLDFSSATREYERAVELGPGNARVLRDYAVFSVYMGRTEAGINAARHAVVIDPLNPSSHFQLFYALWRARQYEESLKAAQDTELVDSTMSGYQEVGWVYYALGQSEKARASCESMEMLEDKACCLAIVYHKLGRRADAEAMLARLRALSSDSDTFQIAQVYAQWGQIDEALEWLDVAVRQRNPQLERLKTSNLLDPLRQEPRFQAIERALKFPD